MKNNQQPDKGKNLFTNYQIVKTELPTSDFSFPDHFLMYYSHLESLDLIKWAVVNKEYPRNELKIQVGLIENGEIYLTDFGKLFVKACIPESGFILMK